MVDNLGNHSTVFNSVFGIINLSLNPKNPWIPTQNNVLEFEFSTENENYKPAKCVVNIDSKGNHNFDIYLERKNVEKLGIKEYTYSLYLNDESTLDKQFSFSTTNNELSFSIPKNTSFTDKDGKKVTNQKITLNIKYFLNISKVPIPKNLINNVREADGRTSNKAVDFYHIAEVVFYDEKGQQIFIENNSLLIKFRIFGNHYNPITKKSLQLNDEVQIIYYNSADKIWEIQENSIVQSDSTGFYTEFNSMNSQYIALSNSVNTCKLNARFQINFLNHFEELPVGLRVNLYRKKDNRYIENKVLMVNNSGQTLDINFTSIEEEPIKFFMYNHSNNNPFSVITPVFFSDKSCGEISEPLNVEITSSRIQVEGTIKFNFDEPLPNNGITGYADILKKSNNTRLHRSKFYVTSTDSVFYISTGIITNVDAYIKIVSTDEFTTINTIPESIQFNTTNGPFEWEFELTHQDISRDVVFDFDIDDSFEDRELSIKADFKNMKTATIENSLFFNVSKGNQEISRKIILDKNSEYQIKIKRIEGKELFMAYPYEFKIKKDFHEKIQCRIKLEPVNKKQVTANIKLICGSSIIYPTLNGMYKTVWDDSWKELRIRDGNFSEIFELGAMYEIGTVFENALVSTTYLIDTTIINLTMEIEGKICDSMGW